MVKENKTMEKNRVFVYGTLKREHINNSLLKTSVFVGTAETISKYLLLELGVPFLVDNSNHHKSCIVQGEVYTTNKKVLDELDILEGHPTFYRRKPIWVTMDNKPNYVWAYLYNIEDDNLKNYNILDSGVF